MYNFSLDYRLDDTDKRLTGTQPDSGNDDVQLTVEQEQRDACRRIKCTLRPRQPIRLKKFTAEIQFSFTAADRIYANGFQSWSGCREWAPHERLAGLNRWFTPVIRHYCLQQYGDYACVRYPSRAGVFHGFTYGYVRRGEHYTLVGSLGEQSGYTVVTFDTDAGCIRAHKECDGAEISADHEILHIVLLEGSEQEVFAAYFRLLGLSPVATRPCTGWTSWYNYYEKIDEATVLRNLKAFARRRLPIDFFQIDDGYQQAVGDWLVANGKFPRGMQAVAAAIHDAGYQAGLWLAPFICEKKSSIVRDHPDWLLRDARNRPVVAGYNPFNWSGEFYPLDIYHPKVRQYIEQVFDTVLNDWRYDLVKLDFLYAVALLPQHGRARGQVMCEAMQWLRHIIGERKILGCGVPLGPAFGQVDYCRIGSDVAPYWEDRRLVKLRYRERVSTFNSLTNTLSRRQLNGLAFANDPDVFLLRQQRQSMSPQERHTLFLLNLILGQLVFTSDDLDEYDADEMRRYLSQFPFKARRLEHVGNTDGEWRIAFAIDDRRYLALANLDNQPRQLTLADGIYFAPGRRWWQGGQTITLPPHTSLCLLVVADTPIAIAGSENHVFAGSEIAGMDVVGNRITIHWEPQAQLRGPIYLKLPPQLGDCEVNGRPCRAETLAPGVYGICYTEATNQ